MARQYSSVAIVKIVFSGGRKLLEDIQSISVGKTREKKAVNTLNRRRVGRGFRKATQAVTWNIEVPIPQGELEVDWEKIRDDDEEFMLLIKRDDNGRTMRLVDAVVNEVTEDSTEDGDHMLRVSGIALDYVAAK